LSIRQSLSFLTGYLIFFHLLIQPLPAGDFSADSIRKHLEILGSDAMQGRGTGTDGTRRASDYIAACLKNYGVQFPPGQQEYFQYIPMHGSFPLSTTRFTLIRPDTQIQLNLGRDYLMQSPAADVFIQNPASLVFVGYGIIAPEFDYNDYATVDVEDRIVVFIAGEPVSEDPDYFDGLRPTIYSDAETKRRIAASRGAKGSILIPVNTEGAVYSWSKVAREFAFEDIRLAYTINTHLNLVINPDLTSILFPDGENIFQMHEEGSIRSFVLDAAMTFDANSVFRDFRDRNVVGFARGSDPALNDTYLILSAHYDHLGIGPPVSGDSIYNGVIDNASGTAALLEICRIVLQSPVKPRRSMLFIFTTAEEKGLLGSIYYTENPLVPLYRTIANINIDGLSVFDEFNDVIAVGSEQSSLSEDLEDFLETRNLKLSALPEIFFDESESFTRSDQFAFAKAGIPSVLLVEGLDKRHMSFPASVEQMLNWNLHIYHSPFDDLDQNLNYNAAVQHTELIYGFALYLANSDRSPQWKRGAPFYTTRLRSIAEKK
jgi:hypothetical protein